jgi:DNA-binding Lrp family transcriptional regulator
MVTAIELLKVDRKKINEVADQLLNIEGIAEVYSVSGRYDLVTIIRAKDNEALADIITRNTLKVDHIQESETLFAFRCYSKHDLERMFSLGFDEQK